MPAYLWTCHLCGTTNEPGVEACAHCGFAAVASGRDIERARRSASGATDARASDLNPYRTFWRRFFAAWVDLLVFLPLFWLDSLVWKTFSEPTLLLFWFLVCSNFGVAYSILLHGSFGQTVGKWVLRVKVFDVSGTKLSMRQAALRDSVPLVAVVYGMLVDLPLVLNGVKPHTSDVEPRLSTVVLTYAMTIWFWLEIITMLLNDKRRSLHDFIAGSVVMRLHPSSRAADVSQVRV